MSKKIVVTISALLILGLILFFGRDFKNKSTVTPVQNDKNSLSNIDNQTKFDSTSQINNDVNSMDTSSSIDSDLDQLNAEIQGL